MHLASLRTVVVCSLTASLLWASGCGDEMPECGDGNGDCACGPTNCGGCCLFGQCVMPSGQNGRACGAGGALCSPCNSGESCDWVLGGCSSLPLPHGDPCGSTCSGCCHAASGRCIRISQQANALCGHSNQDCRECSGAATCSFGRCHGEDSIGPGCDPSLECFSQYTRRCELGLTRESCGLGGDCEQCGPSHECIDGTCQHGGSALEACLRSCAGKGCCDADAQCIAFMRDQDVLLASLLGDADAPTGTQNDAACGVETCAACRANHRCDAQVGICRDERLLPDFSICIEGVVIADPASADDQHETDQPWDDLWKTDTPQVEVVVELGSQSGSTALQQGRVETVSIEDAASEYVSQRCSFWQRLWDDRCEQQALEAYSASVTEADSIHGYAVSYKDACPLRVYEGALEDTPIEFDVRGPSSSFGLEPGPSLAHCTGEIVGRSALDADCDRTALADCHKACLDEHLSDKSLREHCLGDCYWQDQACLYDDGVIDTLLIRTQCDKGYVLQLQAKAVLVRPASHHW